MPIYEYQCPEGHVSERIRKHKDCDLSVVCHCGKDTNRIVSRPHCVPDGVYSYAENIGSARAHERRQAALESGQRVIKKELD